MLILIILITYEQRLDSSKHALSRCRPRPPYDVALVPIACGKLCTLTEGRRTADAV